jgi:hypothetical protein
VLRRWLGGTLLLQESNGVPASLHAQDLAACSWPGPAWTLPRRAPSSLAGLCLSLVRFLVLTRLSNLIVPPHYQPMGHLCLFLTLPDNASYHDAPLLGTCREMNACMSAPPAACAVHISRSRSCCKLGGAPAFSSPWPSGGYCLGLPINTCAMSWRRGAGTKSGIRTRHEHPHARSSLWGISAR